MMKEIYKGIRRIAVVLAAVLVLASIPDEVISALASEYEFCDDNYDDFYNDYYSDEQWFNEVLSELAEEDEIMATVYLCQELAVKSEPSDKASTVATVGSGQTVYIQAVDPDTGWVYVKVNLRGSLIYGYIPEEFIISTDERYLELKAMSQATPMMMSFFAVNPGDGGDGSGAGDGDPGDGGDGSDAGDGDPGDGGDGSDAGDVDPGDGGDGSGAGEAGPVWSADVECFPESYRANLQALKDAHPNWVFVPMNTGVTLETAVSKELGDKSLVSSSAAACNKDGLYGQKWYYATDGILKYYMDPRNWLTENYIFQFELLTYNASYHTAAALDSYLSNTFMKSGTKAPGTNMNYSFFMYAIGVEQNVSPFHMAARIIQEQGVNGGSPMISGTYPGFEGYYNYYNFKASGKTNEQVIVNGLTYAKNQGWDSAYTSIRGGTMQLKTGYISKGQDTLYLEKFNVNPTATNAMYSHQYQQNIQAPASEGSNVKKMYENSGALDNPFVFKIPVYENMSEEASPKPTESGEVKITIPEGYGETSIWVDGVEYTPYKRNGLWIVNVPETTGKTATMYKYNASNVPVGMYVWSLSYSNGAYTATAETGLEDLLTYHGFSMRIKGKTGIRCKTGILSTTREALLTSGINGYTLKEYGTVIQLAKNRGTYPMVLNGAKTAKGISYGTENEKAVDKIFETVDGRYRYTAVLTSLPVEQYKEDYAFRGYIILNKNGQDVIIYGPVVAKNMYNMAGQMLDSGKYEVGSETYIFLTGLREQADAQ